MSAIIKEILARQRAINNGATVDEALGREGAVVQVVSEEAVQDSSRPRQQAKKPSTGGKGSKPKMTRAEYIALRKRRAIVRRSYAIGLQAANVIENGFCLKRQTQVHLQVIGRKRDIGKTLNLYSMM